MEPDRLEHLYSVLFDERQESWYFTSPHSRRIPLTRATLHHLVSLYNDIHRGAPMSLVERRAVEQLGAERTELQETIHSLYDYIDATCATPSAAPVTMLGSWINATKRLIARSFRRPPQPMP